MKKALVTLLAVLTVTGCSMISAKADDSADIAALKQQVADSQKKIAEIEAKQAQAGTLTPSSIKFGGYFRGRIDASEAENTTLEAAEVAFEPRWDSASDKVHGEVHLWFYPSNTFYLESAMMTFDNAALGKGGKLIAGKTRNWTYGITPTGGNRLLSDYSLYSDSFTHDRVVGFQSLNKLAEGKVDLNIAVINGFAIGTRGPGIALTSGNITRDFTASPTPWRCTTEVLANREAIAAPENNPSLDQNNNKAVSARVGFTVSPELNIGISEYYGKISNTSRTAVNTLTGFATANNKHSMLGGDFKFKDGAWVWQSEYTTAKLAGLKYDGYQTTVGYTFTPKYSGFIQYGAIDYKITPDKTKSASWDKDQLSISIKRALNKKAWLQLEHEFNGEDIPTGTNDITGNPISKIKNDTTFLEYVISL